MSKQQVTSRRSEVEEVVVIILSFNQREMTLRCIESLLDDLAPPFRILVWDNGSTDDTVNAIGRRFPEVFTHYSERNLGVASGRNAAARLVSECFKSTHILFLDNDMVVESGFVASLLRPFREDSLVGQTQAKLRLMKDPERLNDGGGCEISFVLGRTRPVGFEEIDHGQYDYERPCVACGGAMMVRTDVFERLGGFDRTFDPFGPEDIDFSLRLSKAGYRALFIPDALAYHEVSHTFGAGYSAEYARHKIRHWLFFMRRHASRPKILAFLCLTAPWLLLRALFREAARGNFTVFSGFLKGIADAGRTWREAGRTPDDRPSQSIS